MGKEKIEILNKCHTKHIAGMESIHTKEFPAAYTETALDAMDIFGEQQSVEFFEWVNKNYYRGMNGYVPHGWGAYSANYTIKQLYKMFLDRDWILVYDKKPKEDKELFLKYKDGAISNGYYAKERRCMLSTVASGAGECGEGFTNEERLPVDDVTHWKYAKEKQTA